MAQSPPPSIRELLLAEIKAQEPTGPISASLQQGSILDAVARKVGCGHDEAILTQWSELFRTGLLAWGLDLSNPNPPFFHLTERGRIALAHLTRDPSNPAGYLRHLASIASLTPVADSYLREGLECYVAGLFKASAVMIGAAAESLILSLRDETVQRLTALGIAVPKQLQDWRAKTVSDALKLFFDGHKKDFDRQLWEAFEANWSPLALQIRSARNDAGHPVNIDPVTPDSAHASLLVFPELARLAKDLTAVVASLK